MYDEKTSVIPKGRIVAEVELNLLLVNASKHSFSTLFFASASNTTQRLNYTLSSHSS